MQKRPEGPVSPFKELELPTSLEGLEILTEEQPEGFRAIQLEEERKGWSKKGLRELNRKPKAKTPRKRGPKKKKYWYRKMKEREHNAKNYQKRGKWMYQGMDCYERLKYNCSSKGLTLNISREEFGEMVPDFEERGGVNLFRYDKGSKVVDRYSVDILEDGGRVIYSGSEAKLRSLGYIF